MFDFFGQRTHSIIQAWKNRVRPVDKTPKYPETRKLGHEDSTKPETGRTFDKKV